MVSSPENHTNATVSSSRDAAAIIPIRNTLSTRSTRTNASNSHPLQHQHTATNTLSSHETTTPLRPIPTNTNPNTNTNNSTHTLTTIRTPSTADPFDDPILRRRLREPEPAYLNSPSARALNYKLALERTRDTVRRNEHRMVIQRPLSPSARPRIPTLDWTFWIYLMIFLSGLVSLVSSVVATTYSAVQDANMAKEMNTEVGKGSPGFGFIFWCTMSIVMVMLGAMGTLQKCLEFRKKKAEAVDEGGRRYELSTMNLRTTSTHTTVTTTTTTAGAAANPEAADPEDVPEIPSPPNIPQATYYQYSPLLGRAYSPPLRSGPVSMVSLI